jgi:hypothetical protein
MHRAETSDMIGIDLGMTYSRVAAERPRLDRPP